MSLATCGLFKLFEVKGDFIEFDEVGIATLARGVVSGLADRELECECGCDCVFQVEGVAVVAIVRSCNSDDITRGSQKRSDYSQIATI